MIRNNIVAIALCTAGIFNANAQGDTWTQLDEVNGAPKSACIGFELNGEGYIGLGLDETFERRQLYSYDVAQDDWDDQENIGNGAGLGLSRCAAVAFSIGNLAYAGLGSSTGNAYFGDFWEYNPANDTWSQMANFGGTARRQAVGFAINGKGYVGTGVDVNGDYKKDFWEYDPATNTWTQLNDFGGTARQSAVGFTMGNNAYLGTGDDGVPRKDFWQYNPVTDQWTQKPDFPGTARAGAVGFGIYPQAFIATGYDIDLSYTDDIWEFNADNDTWIQRTDFPGFDRAKGVAFVINDIAYFGTGYNDDYLDDFWSYSPAHICADDTTESSTDICTNDSYLWVDGNTYTELDGSGPFYHTVSSIEWPTCDSVLKLNINWNQPSTSISNTNQCTDGSYSWIDGNTYLPVDGAGPFYHTLFGASQTGCDSTIALNINWLTAGTGDTYEDACESAGFVWSGGNGNTYVTADGSGPFDHTLLGASISGCDSTISLHINWLTTGTSDVYEEACGSAGFDWSSGNGNSYVPADGAGPFDHTLMGASSSGCDSTISLHINWLLTGTSISYLDACENIGFEWTNGNGNTYTPADGSGPFDHTLVGASSLGCDSTISIYLTWYGIDDLTLYDNGTSLTSNATGIVSYQWVDCDNNYAFIPGETSASYTPTSAGSYAVILTGSNCEDTSECITSYVGIDELSFELLNVYPNPTTGSVHIDLGETYENISIEVKNVLGQIIKLNSYQLTQHVELEIEGAQGLYFIDIMTQDGRAQTVKLFKQ